MLLSARPTGAAGRGAMCEEASWGLSRGLKQWVLWEDAEPNLNGTYGKGCGSEGFPLEKRP